MVSFERANVLVTGGAGFIGTNLILGLLSRGVEVRATYFDTEPTVRHKKVEYVRCDLRRMKDCQEIVKGINLVYMCAAVTSGAAAIASNPIQHVTANNIINSQMLEASYLAHVGKFVFISSTVVYPFMGKRPCREDEGFRGEPYEAYFASGWMKRYAEKLCEMYSTRLKNPMPTVVLRPTNPYGPYDKFEPEVSHVTAALIRKVVERQNPLVVWGTGKDVRDLIYIDDLVEAIILSAENLKSFCPINIGFGKGHSVTQILKTLLDLDGYRDARVVYDASLPRMIPIRLVDTTKARRMLGFRPKVELKEGLKRTLAWYRTSGQRGS